MKRFFAMLFSIALVIGMIPFHAFAKSVSFDIPTAEAGNTDEPLIIVGAIADPHTDYGLQNKDPYIRTSYITALNALKAEGMDLLLVGGDITSDNEDNGKDFRWSQDVYWRTVSQYQKYSSEASKTGITLWAVGNHDHEVGRLSNILDPGDYNSSQGFFEMMIATAGYPLDLYVEGQEPNGGIYDDHWLGAHYNVNGFDFITINPPYANSDFYSLGTLKWLDDTLAKIGADKTVFITGHYPLVNSRGPSSTSLIGGTNYTNFMNVMKKYNNAIYLFGHIHDNDKGYISSDTFERVTHYDEDGKVVTDRNAAPTSFISSFMGSASYYKYSLNPDWLTAADPKIIQALVISVYADRIEFKMINCGEKEGAKREPDVWTVTRDVKCSGEVTDETPLLVTEDVTDDVFYGSVYGINKYKMPSGTTTLTNANHTLEGEGLDGLTMTVKRLYAGTKYTGYSRKLSKVVKDAVYFDYLVKKGTRAQKIETPVKVTVPALLNEFGDKTSGVELAAYYWDLEGKLCMTDAVVNEDGSYSFVMTNLSVFALSARANVKDSMPRLQGEDDKTETDMTTVIIIAAVAVAVIAASVIVICVAKKSKKAPKASEKDQN